MSARQRRRSRKREPKPTGILEIDRLATLPTCMLEDYIRGVSAYVQKSAGLDAGAKKAGQIRLSNALGRALASELEERLPKLKGRIVTEETRVSGALRTAQADVSETHPLDGLRLAVEIKPVNLAVGRAIWNRFGDIRTFAVNLHLKFPFCVIGGVLVIPTYEAGTVRSEQVEEDEDADLEQAAAEPGSAVLPPESRKSTIHLIEKAVARLIRAGGRKNEAEAAHLLEAIAVVVYDPDTAMLHPDLPPKSSGLRWQEFLDNLALTYESRFED
jgi:hypothetical protein